MKTTIEVGGFEIKIEEMEGNITVSAMKEGEVIEEFELSSEDFDSQEMGEEEDDDMMSFGDDDMEEEEDFGDDDMEEGEEMEEEEGEEMEEEEEEDESQGKLESFSHFVKKRKK
jgi:hypothetical protein